MVVGGGIAGMQASLDLAESGYKVYLVEKKSAVGGHMAQLDKTFPTNDCAMCTISPRLVDTSSHLNIEILTDSEVASLEGEAGAFTATIQAKARYIDVDTCNGCGKCAEVCPEPVPSLFNEGLAKQRAAYRLYPQAIPAAFAIEKQGVAPCRDACPTGQRAQGYIALIREGRYADALRTIKEDNPFPAICGRICDHRCESACSRGKVDEPVNIRGLKRFVVDLEYAKPRTAPGRVERRREERVAIIGAGPCGLTAAQDLVRHGYGVTVFEALPAAGGMLRFGVPEHRLPAEVIDREIQDIVDLGVDLRLNSPVESLDALLEEGYKAVLISVGAQEGIRLPIPGNTLEGVIVNTQFLKNVRLAEWHRARGDEAAAAVDPRRQIENKRVIVIGGGNVAVDVARSAIRLGALKVSMAVRGSTGGVPASAAEQKATREEGIEIDIGLNFLEVVDDGRGRVAGLKCERVARFEIGPDGKRRAVVQPGSEFVMPADVVVFSVGQRVGLGFVPDGAGVNVSAAKTVTVDPKTFATGRPGVFAAGDSISGTAFVIEAVASGHKSAEAIHRYLRDGSASVSQLAQLPVATLDKEDLDRRVRKGQIKRAPRVPMPEIPVASRLGGFTEVELGYSEEEARREAERCLSCGICSECEQCVWVCGVNAIDHRMLPKQRKIQIGAVVLAPGYEPYRAQLSEEFGWGRFPNVMTSLQFERLLSASGPTSGHVERPSDGRTPKRIAFLQCVGSRDATHDYCSAVCCMYASKQAVQAIEHEAETQAHVFMMDMRAFSKGYEAYYRTAKQKYGIGYTRCRISSVKEDPATNDLLLRYWDRAGSKEMTEERFDMVVLSVGMEISSDVQALGRRLGVELDEHGFCKTVQFDPLQTSRRGVYAVGPFREPKDIADSLLDASGAAARASAMLAQARGTLSREAEYPVERDVGAEPAKTAVFVCHCGTNIAGFVDVADVAKYAKSLPGVIHTEESLYACSRDSVVHITDTVKQTGANRVVIASCSPLTHERLFQNCTRNAGLNPYLVDIANIRNQCSWVHSKDRKAATQKAKELVRMSAARATELEPLPTGTASMNKTALVVGGGAAGMTVALNLAAQGFPVHLVEKEAELGGNLKNLHYSLQDAGIGTPLAVNGGLKSPREFLDNLLRDLGRNPLITVHRETVLGSTTGFLGNFTTTLTSPDGKTEKARIDHGVAVLAVGGVEYKGDEYCYGQHPRIVTQSEFEALLASGAAPDTIAMILCVGPADRYCGRICCTSALKNAMILKKRNPAARVTIIYKDIRTYGFKERIYRNALDAGIVFVRYQDGREPAVETDGGSLTVSVHEEVLGEQLVIEPDYLVLSTPVVPSAANQDLSLRLKVPVDMDGFFMEAHVKLRPVDFLSEGLFMAGMAHYPKFLEETIVHAQAAAARAGALLSRDTLTTSGRVAQVNPELCTACLTCVRSCAYSAVRIDATLTGIGGIIGAARIEAALCQGCGLCVASCPAEAIELKHYTATQIDAKLDALLAPQTKSASHEHHV
jgi:heterodisulfide reductase subunit A-like polyferredoxin